jgi:hypothetical protein
LASTVRAPATVASSDGNEERHVKIFLTVATLLLAASAFV